MTTPRQADEWRRLGAARSIADVIAADEDVSDMSALTGAEVPSWITQLPLAPGWQLLAPSHGVGTALARVAVWGPRKEAGFEGTETLQAFALTGVPWFPQLVRNASGVLRDLAATEITTRVLNVPPGPGRLAMRSTGIFLVVGRPVWAQYSFFLAASEYPHAGRLVEHQLLIDVQQQQRLSDDIAALSDAVQGGFIAALEDRGTPPREPS